jgi:molybdate transport system substrate-binding protein
MKKLFRSISVSLLLVATVAGLLRATEPETLKVAAAANLSGVMAELKDTFIASHKDVKIDVITASSGKITMQVLSGAPFDVFMSADMENPQKLKEQGYAANDPAIYAFGTLIMFTTKDVDLKKGVSIVTSSEVAKVSIADPNLAPYGKAAVEALEKLGVLDAAKKKFVTATNISEVVTQTVNGADLGFTALSLMYADGIKQYNVEGKNWVAVDSTLYSPIRQAIVVLKHGKHKPEAKAFYNFILSKQAGEIFKKYGYK